MSNCAYCIQSEGCGDSAYLVLSRNLTECNYCFGCVGLNRKDFHILNQSFSKKAYFKLTAQLRKELGL